MRRGSLNPEFQMPSSDLSFDCPQTAPYEMRWADARAPCWMPISPRPQALERWRDLLQSIGELPWFKTWYSINRGWLAVGQFPPIAKLPGLLDLLGSLQKPRSHSRLWTVVDD